MPKKQDKSNCEYVINSLRIGNLTVNIRSGFSCENNLYDIMFRITSLRLKDRAA